MDDTQASTAKRRLFNFIYVAMVLGLPLVTWYLTASILGFDGALVAPLEALRRVAPPLASALGFYLGWLAFQALLMLVLPGKIVQGMPLEGGRTLPYKTNGLSAFGVTVGLALGLTAGGVVPATFLYDHLAPLVTTANLVVLGLCVLLLVFGRRQATAEERRRGLLEAFVMGATLNPRTKSFDWKFFCESRPGMILWVLIDLSCAAAQHARHGAVSDSMALVVLFQAFYVLDYFVVEEAILTTWDIRHEPFGFMLCWGCLVWIPFTFSLQALYLVTHPVDLPTWAVVGITVLNFTGYYIFRSSNLQKNRFRREPGRPIWGKTPEFIATQRGTKLLVSGWWGIARHANYLGDLMMGLSWCLVTGTTRLVPYFYFIYFVILLVHRERRDFEHCARKYGEDWRAYAARVRWRILPGVY